MRIPIIDAIAEKREAQRRRAKRRKVIVYVAAITAGVLSLAAAVLSVIHAVKRCKQSCEEGKCLFRSALEWVREKLGRERKEPVYYVDGFTAEDNTIDMDAFDDEAGDEMLY